MQLAWFHYIIAYWNIVLQSQWPLIALAWFAAVVKTLPIIAELEITLARSNELVARTPVGIHGSRKAQIGHPRRPVKPSAGTAFCDAIITLYSFISIPQCKQAIFTIEFGNDSHLRPGFRITTKKLAFARIKVLLT